MDEALFRRLLGAAALLGAAFLVASLLPNPDPNGLGDDTVVAYDLRTGLPIGANRLPPVERPPALKPEERLEPRPAAEALEPAAALPRTTLKVDETLEQPGGWFVQVGSFSSQANARKALQELFGMGLPTVIQAVDVGKTRWYRVRVGPYPAEGAAQAVLSRVKKNGYSTAKLVRPETDPAPKGN